MGKEFIFCNDPFCEADKAVDFLEGRIDALEAVSSPRQIRRRWMAEIG